MNTPGNLAGGILWVVRLVSRCLLLLLGALGALSGCSADSVSAPEPSLDSKGAFVAIATSQGDYELLRTLSVLGSGGDDDVFFVAPYAVHPQSFAEARELAQDPELQPKQAIAVGRRYITSRDWRVVWFRSVSFEEEAGFR